MRNFETIKLFLISNINKQRDGLNSKPKISKNKKKLLKISKPSV